MAAPPSSAAPQHGGESAPAWLSEGIAPTAAEMRQGRDGGDQARKRLRAPVAFEPGQRRLHQLMAAQLYSEGYVTAANAVVRSTGCYGPTALLYAEAGKHGQRLARLVTTAENVERLKRPHPTAGTSAPVEGKPGTVEAALFGESVYAAAAPPASYQFGEIYSSMPLDRPLRCAAFTPEAEYVACGATNGTVRIFSSDAIAEWGRRVEGAVRSAPTRQGLVRTFANVHDQAVEWVGFHPRHPVVISAGRDGRLGLTDYVEPQGRPASELLPPLAKRRLASNNNNGAKDAGNAAASDAAKSADAAACYQDTFPIRAVAVHPDGEYAAVATDHSSLRVVNFRTGALFSPTESHRAAISDVSMNSDGRLISTASYDGSWRVIDARSGSTAHKPNSPLALATVEAPAHSGVAVTSCELSRSGRVLLTTGADNQTKLWDLRKAATEVTAFGDVRKVSQRLRSRFLFDEASIAVDGAERMATDIYDVFSGVRVATLAHQQTQRALACSPAAQVIATGGDDFRLRLWSPAQLTLLMPEDV